MLTKGDDDGEWFMFVYPDASYCPSFEHIENDHQGVALCRKNQVEQCHNCVRCAGVCASSRGDLTMVDVADILE